jgi:acid phosphatase
MSRRPARRGPLTVLLPALLLLAACAAPEPVPDRSALDAVVFMRTAAERDALCLQAFAAARSALGRALADTSWTACLEQAGPFAHKPPAVIADVDDTLLDTSSFETRALFEGWEFDNATFARWAEAADAPALPGAAEFLRDAAARGVTVFYVTGRGPESREATRRNLQRHGFPLATGREVVLTREDTSDKGPRRAAVAADFRVLLLLGDNAADFGSGFAGKDVDARRAAARQAAASWGERWIVLPNAAYGDWQRAALGWRDVPGGQRTGAKLETLRATLPGG